jgi:hypothetical protein
MYIYYVTHTKYCGDEHSSTSYFGVHQCFFHHLDLSGEQLNEISVAQERSSMFEIIDGFDGIVRHFSTEHLQDVESNCIIPRWS